jgi:hypothetical protein
MSKKKAANPKTSTSSNGYTEVKDRVELAGWWNPEAGPIHGKLVEAYQYIQKSGKGRGGTRTMFVIDLADPCVARVKLDGGGLDETTLQPRELCGVLGSIGLRMLVTLGGCFVRIERQGKRTLGNGNEMWAYKVSYKGKPQTLDVRPPFASTDDNVSRASNGATENEDADELPF